MYKRSRIKAVRLVPLQPSQRHPPTYCCDFTGTRPGERFIVRNVGAFVLPYDGSAGYHGTAAAIEFAVLSLDVCHIIVCGHTHRSGTRALYEEVPPGAHNLAAWLEPGRETARSCRPSKPVTAEPGSMRSVKSCPR
jgi:carbonic anhydrase